ncbi:MAG TPA: hypothetical protein P5522_12855, partial [Spirochaetia bacterium]|nr:hypothetical protein [Spirochaetia bacterium]
MLVYTLWNYRTTTFENVSYILFLNLLENLRIRSDGKRLLRYFLLQHPAPYPINKSATIKVIQNRI